MAPIDIVQAQAEEATRRQNRRERRSDVAERRTRAEAADRQRHRRPLVDIVHRPDRSTHAWRRGDRPRGRRTQRPGEPYGSPDGEEEHRRRQRAAAQPEQSDAAVVEPARHLPSRWQGRHDDPDIERPPASPTDQLVGRARRHRQLGSADLDGADAVLLPDRSPARRKPTRRGNR